MFLYGFPMVKICEFPPENRHSLRFSEEVLRIRRDLRKLETVTWKLKMAVGAVGFSWGDHGFILGKPSENHRKMVVGHGF